MKSLYVQIDDKLHAKLKKVALQKGISMKELITVLIKENLC